MCVWVYSRGHPFPYPAWCNWTLQRMDGALADVWPYFPVIKVGKTFISIFQFWLFGGVDCKSWNGTIIPELYRPLSGWIFFSCYIYWLSQGSFRTNSFVEQLQIRLVLYLSTWVNNPIRKRDLPGCHHTGTFSFHLILLVIIFLWFNILDSSKVWTSSVHIERYCVKASQPFFKNPTSLNVKKGLDVQRESRERRWESTCLISDMEIKGDFLSKRVGFLHL